MKDYLVFIDYIGLNLIYRIVLTIISFIYAKVWRQANDEDYYSRSRY